MTPRIPWLQSSPIEYPPALPITVHLQEIRGALTEHQVIVVAGETGSGKTTQLPKLMLELGRGCEAWIGHTQPRRIAARSVAQRIAEELNTELGAQIGFQVRFHQRFSEATYVKLMTDGVLLAELAHDRLLKRYDTLIIDEAHERSLNIDFILGYLKWLLPKRPDLKIIITSATLDHQRFSKHFHHCPVIEVSGRGYPVDIVYRALDEKQSQDIAQMQGILNAIKALESDGDVLVFLAGEREIRQTDKFLSKAALRHTEILPLYSRLSPGEQQRIFQAHAMRRIILSTNVAETSLTIPNIKYVIDAGFARIKRYHYRSKIQRLPIEAISQASAKQRAGRCGRIAPGMCIRLYSEEDFQLREAYTQPEILRSNLASVILQMLSLGLGDPQKFPWLDPPEPQYWRDAYQCLEELQAIDSRGVLTTVGKALAKIPLDPRLARMLLTAVEKNCQNEVLVIVSALSVADIFVRPMDYRQAADEKHREFLDPQSDFLAYLNVWQKLTDIQHHQSNNKLRQYCDSHFLSYLKFREWQDLYHELKAHLQISEIPKADFNAPLSDAKNILIHQSLLSGLLTNVAQKDEEGTYLAVRQRCLKIFPGSALFKKPPKWLMALEIVETKHVYARTIASIDPTWIEPLALHLIKKTHNEPHWDVRRGEVLANEKVLLFGLVIVPKRRVRYSKLDPKISHEVFLRQALAQRQFKTTLPFWQHNEKFLIALEEMEEQTRSRHFVPDEEWLYQFYQDKIPVEISSQVECEKWYKAADTATRSALMLTDEHLKEFESSDHRNAYPTEFVWQENHLKLSYQFSPESVEDGVSVHVPLVLLAQLPSEVFDWLVPGFLEQKILAILKDLPKDMRKMLMPIQESAAACVFALRTQSGKSFFAALSFVLKSLFQLEASAELLMLSNIPYFLKFNFKIFDEEKLLAQGRDLFALKQQFLPQSNQQEKSSELYLDWPCDLPFEIKSQRKGLMIVRHPALQAEAEGVIQRELDALALAKQIHRFGVAKLLRLKCQEALKYIVKKLLLSSKNIKNRLQFGHANDDFLGYFEYALIFMTFAEDFWKIRSKADFERCYEMHEQDLLANANLLVPVVQSILIQLAVDTFADDLLFPGFLAVIPWEWLERYPLYLEALLFSKGSKISEEYQILKNDYQRQVMRCLKERHITITSDTPIAFDPVIFFNAYDCLPESLLRIGYLLRELEMSLRMPRLKTVETVSIIRIRKALEKLADSI